MTRACKNIPKEANENNFGNVYVKMPAIENFIKYSSLLLPLAAIDYRAEK